MAGLADSGKDRQRPWRRPDSSISTAAELIKRFEIGQVAVVAGFRGSGRTTGWRRLGRGGSDTSAVAIAAAVKADRCDIYTDVDGVYTTDPRVEPKARRMKKIAFEEMLEMASLGAKVLQVRSVELAMVHKVRTFVRSSFDDPDGPEMGNIDNPPGTLICDEEEIVEQEVVTGIAFAKDEAQISLRRLSDRPGVSAAIFGPLGRCAYQCRYDCSEHLRGRISNRHDLHGAVERCGTKALAVLEGQKEGDRLRCGAERIRTGQGLGHRHRHAQPCRRAASAFKALAEKSINIKAITTSEIKISILIDGAYAELAVRTLHSVYGLDKT
jgi:aspartate kinase